MNAIFGFKVTFILLEVEPNGDVTAILVSDDDKGATRLFELKLRFQQ